MIYFVSLLICFFLPFYAYGQKEEAVFKLISPAFESNGEIPQRYTCHGSDINPPLIFSHVPLKTKSFALTISNPDAPEGNWSHWIVYNISPKITKIKENSRPGTEGLSDFGKYSYAGPCPVDDHPHHYVFRVYALDEILYVNEAPTLLEVEKAVRDHTLAKAELIGIYQNSVFVDN